ncbi:MAG: hypothetical protein M3Y04_04805 [Actinomycetota bacterium]|nr:hypothetical protein [Actinomycetota bacterium]
MTTTVQNAHRFGNASPRPAEVVAVLINDGSAQRVASVAVQEAVERHAIVRFLQVVSAHLDEEGRSLVEETMFRTGLHALRRHSHMHSVFEVVTSNPPALVGSRSRGAALVVVGLDDHDSPGARSLADQVRGVAGCPVRTVPAGR